MLHAINASDGTEQWAFVPPFIAAKLPTIVNKGLDGKLPGRRGGSNAIFGVDGSPVVHDMYIRGLDQTGKWEEGKSWRTILIIPYGRGGAGFSVLDVTYPDAGATGGPLHMYSIFNDTVQNRVLVANHRGVDKRTSLYSRVNIMGPIKRGSKSSRKSKYSRRCRYR